MNTQSYIEVLRTIIVGEASYVLFENGTAVFLVACEGDLQSAASEVLRQHGQVEIGTPAGDFNVIDLGEDIGWGVTFEHPDLLSLVLPSEINVKPSDLMIGLLGRNKRGDDAAKLKVVHVEDRRAGENSNV
ncbi:hypothetical protein B1R32_10741 [Abditibacterium utsteinense]|uniref:Uncharacterized protein n=1 Tax=Abditibacterium utsteinense TaxID=1960156 RepID=A0A2S8STA8_9BACT|nr:hypothetical protein [Abditibacterium utsteinense]PQV64016.1 hypothetical protein B1R32_10741 [Abditibacterium utsteinense]